MNIYDGWIFGCLGSLWADAPCAAPYHLSGAIGSAFNPYAAISCSGRSGDSISAYEQAQASLAATTGALNATLNVGVVEELPTGIFWERTSGKTHRVTIRRETEYRRVGANAMEHSLRGSR